MKYLLSFLLLIGFTSFGQVETKIQIPISSYPNFRPALLHLPDDYATATSTRYALLVFGHGAGEKSGTNATDGTYQAGGYLNKIYNNAGSGGPSYFIEQGIFPSSFTNPVDGLQYKFIIITPQNDSWSVYTTGGKDIIAWAVANYRVDTNRIYTTGLSAGGEEMAMGYEAEYDIEAGTTIAPLRYKPAAVLLMSPALPNTVNPTWVSTSMTDSVPNWGFGSPSNDPYGQRAKDFIDAQNVIKPNYSRFTTYSSGHCCWNTFYNPSYTEVIGGQTMNVYQWLLTKKRGASAPVSPNGAITFTLPSTMRTSAGVFRISDTTLVRTLWTDSIYSAGTYTKYWDGKDDNGVTIASPDANYMIKVLRSNVVYAWDGIIGNTSSSKTGQGVHRGTYTSMIGMAITGTTAYFCQGYSEGYPSEAKFSTTAPQVRLNPFSGNATMNSELIATDGINVYWAGYDGVAQGTSFIHASKVSDDTQFSFGANGSSYAVTYGRTYSSIIDKTTGNIQGHVTGLAVSGTYLFASHKGLNQVHVFNKTTGALVQTLAYSKPDRLAIDGSSLWMVTDSNVVSKYTINANGTLTAATLTLSGVNTAGAIAVKPGTIAVIDAGLQQIVRFYNTTSGVQGASLGTVGGYLNSPSVTNTKFMFDGYVLSGKSYLAYAPDGSLWVGDGGNYRNQHFSASNTFIETIMSMGATYTIAVDPNNINRVFGNYLEFNVDYTPLSGSTGWTLVKNWGYIAGAANGTLYKLINIVTLSNGRTYCFNYYQGFGELSPTGFRFINNPFFGGQIDKDGSLQKTTGRQDSGSNLVVTRYPLTGFDGSNNPIWSTTGTVMATTPTNNEQNPNTTPVTDALTYHQKTIFYTTTIQFLGNINKPQNGYHLGAIFKGDNKWRWETMNATHRAYQGLFPNADRFDRGNGVNDYAGSQVNVIDSNIIAGYHGEFWKNGETNYYNHFLDDGLAIGQFGTDGSLSSPFSDSGNAGNALTIALVRNNASTLYLFHGDESQHSGVHRWSISNANSVVEDYQTIPFPSAYVAPVIVGYTDLHAGLPFNATLATQNGWSSTGTVDYYSNRKKYINDGSPDVLVTFVPPYTRTSGNASVQRDLGNNNVTTSWKITTTINFGGSLTIGNGNKIYIDVLDGNGKVLARFYWVGTYNPFPTPVFSLYGNTARITNDVQAGPNEILSSQPLTIQCTNGNVTFTYGTFASVSDVIYDPAANWRTPKTFRAYTIFGNPSSGLQVGFVDSKLFLDPNVTSTVYYISTSGGDDSRTAIQAQNQATPWKTTAKVNASFSLFNPGDHISYKAGEVFPGTLTPTKSGMLSNPIVFDSYGSGAKPVLTAMKTLSGWTNVGTNLWESAADASLLAEVNMVTFNGLPYAMGRFPNADAANRGYLTYQSHSGNNQITSNQITGIPSYAGNELVIRKTRFSMNRGLITSQSGGTLIFTNASTQAPTDGYGFFIQNGANLLDQQGEWYYNPATKKVRAYFSANNPNSYVVQANNLDNVVSDRSFSYHTFNNLAFEGGGLRTMDLYQAAGVLINNCSFDKAGTDALFGATSTNLTVTNTTFNHSNNNAINLISGCDGYSITGNLIKNSGSFQGMGFDNINTQLDAVVLNADGGTFQGNEIDSTGYTAVRFTGDNILLSNNFINTYCWNLDDGGAFNTYGGSDSTVSHTNRVIDGNVVINGIGAAEGTTKPGTGSAEGYYIDENASNVTITNNTAANNFNTGILLHNNKGITVTGNTLFNNGTGIYILHNPGVSPLTTMNPRNLVINNNIIAAKAPTQLVMNIKTNLNDINLFGAINNNVEARPIDDNLTFITTVNSNVTTNRNLAGWQVFTGFDLNSTKSSASIPDTSKILFRYNGTNTASTFTLAGNWRDLKNVAYSGTVTLQPYKSVVLIPAAISKINPTITWSNPANKIYPDPINAGDLNATGSVPGVITYNTSVGTIYNPGTYTLTATLTPTDTATYNIVTKNVTLTVSFASGTRHCIGAGSDGGIYFFNHQNYLGTVIDVIPGDTLCINAGTYMYVQLNGLVGTAAKPIVIINEGGQVINTGNNGTSYCYLLNRSRFFKFTGTGSSSFQYGFKAQYISGGIPRLTGVMISVRDSSTDYEIDHMMGDSVGNGFILKIDPADCTPASWRGNWVIRNVKVHDNYIHGSTGEVIYAMNTDQFTVVKNCSNVDTTILPVPGINWEIYNNHFDSSGWDGIQVASCSGCLIHDNFVSHYGSLDIGSQQAGIILGGRSYGSIYNNTVIRGTGNGIEYYGWGKDTLGVNVGNRVNIYNNIVDSVGTSNNPKQDGIYWDSRPTQSDSMTAYIFNNTITRPGRYGINTFNSNGNQAVNKSKVNNNLIVNPGSNYLNQPNGFIYDTTFNQRVATIAAANFVNYAAKNFGITGSSPAFDAGKNLSAYLTTDIIGTNRPQNVAYDDGAYEFIPSGTLITPTITWSIPNKVYNTLIVSSDLQPTSGGVAGTYTFTGIALGQKFPVGTYTVSTLFTPTDRATYNTATGTATFSVTPQPLTGVFSNTTQTFNNTPLQPTFTTSPVAGVAYAITFNGLGAKPVNVGVYNIVASATDPNYSMTPVSGTFTIVAAAGTFSVSNLTYQYDSTLKNITVTTSNPAITYTITGSPQRYKGVYPITVHNTNPNYNVPDVNTTLTITAGIGTVSWTPANLTYPTPTGAGQTNAGSSKAASYFYTPPSGTILAAGTQALKVDVVFADTNLAPINGIIRNITVFKGTDVMTILADTIQYFDGSVKTVTITTLHGGTVTVTYTGAHIAVGDYPFTASYSDPNWQATSVSATLHILTNSAIIRITNFANRVYTGSPISPTVTSAYTYTLTFNGSATVPTNVGSYTTIATINDGIHTGADTVIMTIIKGTPIGTWPAISGGVYPYIVAAPILNASTSVAGTWAYNINIGDTISVGTKAVTATFTPTDAANWNSIVLTNTITVTQGTATINVSNVSQQYDGTVKFITTSTTPPNLDSLIIAYIGNHRDAGSYPFTVQLSNSNFNATTVSGTLIISQGSYQLAWVRPAPIPSGSPLTVLQLNPTSTIPGFFTFNYPLGYVPPTGTIGLVATFHPTDTNYPLQTINTTISVYGTPFLNYFIRNGKTIYLNLLP